MFLNGFLACRNIYISMIYSAVVRNSALPPSSILQKRICFSVVYDGLIFGLSVSLLHRW